MAQSDVFNVVYPDAFQRAAPEPVLSLEALCQCDAEALARFYQCFSGDVRRLVIRLMGPDLEIEDLVQETFLHAINGLSEFRGDVDTLQPWLRRIAVNRVRRRLRTRRRRQWLRLTSEGELPVQRSPDASPDIRLALRRTYSLLERLSADCQMIFALRVIDGCELSEIADLCGVSVSTVKRRLKHARKRFVILAQHDPILCDWLEEGHHD